VSHIVADILLNIHICWFRIDTHICWCTVLHTVTVIQRHSLICWFTDGQIFADLQSDTHSSCDTGIQKQFLIYRWTHRDFFIQRDKHSWLYSERHTHLLIWVYRKTHIFASIQKDTYPCLCTEGLTNFLIYREAHTDADIQRDAYSC